MIWSPYPALGFHMVSRNGVPEPSVSIVYEKIIRYALEMGVDQDAMKSAMLSAPPDGMHYLEQEDMCKAAIATWIQRSCWHE